MERVELGGNAPFKRMLLLTNITLINLIKINFKNKIILVFPNKWNLISSEVRVILI